MELIKTTKHLWPVYGISMDYINLCSFTASLFCTLFFSNCVNGIICMSLLEHMHVFFFSYFERKQKNMVF